MQCEYPEPQRRHGIVVSSVERSQSSQPSSWISSSPLRLRGDHSFISPEFSDEPEDETDDDADDDARRDGEIEGEIVTFDEDIAGELPEKRRSLDKEHHEADDDEDDTDHNDDFCHLTHST
jgi:hypothetical protein